VSEHDRFFGKKTVSNFTMAYRFSYIFAVS